MYSKKYFLKKILLTFRVVIEMKINSSSLNLELISKIMISKHCIFILALLRLPQLLFDRLEHAKYVAHTIKHRHNASHRHRSIEEFLPKSLAKRSHHQTWTIYLLIDAPIQHNGLRSLNALDVSKLLAKCSNHCYCFQYRRRMKMVAQLFSLDLPSISDYYL